MKKYVFYSLLFLLNLQVCLMAQVDLKDIDSSKTYIITTFDGAEFVGKFISFDAKEVTIVRKHLGEIIIPTYQISEIIELSNKDISDPDKYIRDQVFASRYFITTNGIPIKKGDNYFNINLFGPDIQLGIRDNLGIGIMTTWLASPIIGSIKYSIPMQNNSSIALGALVGTGSWVAFDTGLALPYIAVTQGDSKHNFSFSAGYGAVRFVNIFDGERGQWRGDALFSVAGMTGVSQNFSFVFDSFIVTGIGKDHSLVALLIPGFRLQLNKIVALQFGFTAIYYDRELANFPIPMGNVFVKF